MDKKEIGESYGLFYSWSKEDWIRCDIQPIELAAIWLDWSMPLLLDVHKSGLTYLKYVNNARKTCRYYLLDGQNTLRKIINEDSS